jgi:transglutaminase-like putative cysteine protease
MRRVLTLAALGLLAAGLPGLPAAEKPSRVDPASGTALVDAWYRLLLNGAPAGYVRTRVTARGEAGYSVLIEQKLVLQRGPDRTETRNLSAIDEDAQGKILGYRVELGLSAQATRAEGTVQDGFLVIREPSAGASPEKEPRETRIPMHPEAIGYEALRRKLRDGLRKEGDVVEAVVLSPEFRKFARQRSVRKADDAGKKGEPLIRVATTLDILPGMVQEEWYRPDFTAEKISFPVAGLSLTAQRAPAEELIQEKFASPPEVFLSSAVRLKGKIPAGATEAVYAVRLKSGNFAEGKKTFAAAGQEVVREEGPGARVVRVRKLKPPAGSARKPAAGPEFAEYLRANSFIQSEDSGVRAIAAQVAGQETDGWQAARRLEGWVHDNIRVKDMRTAFAGAGEVLRAKAGDCTEHSVLLAALLRSEGLPSRVAAGLVEMEGTLAGHMWVEVFAGGEGAGAWFPLDATRPGKAGAERIAFATSSLESGGLLDLFLEVIHILGNLEVEVVEVKSG